MKTIISALAGVILAGLACVVATPASANVVARVDLSSQRMSVSVNGWTRYNWAVSTARRGYRTPVGSYRPQRMYRSYFSKKYYNSPMPHSIFFRGGYAIHGTNYMGQLGRPALAWLHPAGARQCRDALFAGTIIWQRQQPDRHHTLVHAPHQM
jgi:hypothetical protein